MLCEGLILYYVKFLHSVMCIIVTDRLAGLRRSRFARSASVLGLCSVPAAPGSAKARVSGGSEWVGVLLDFVVDPHFEVGVAARFGCCPFPGPLDPETCAKGTTALTWPTWQ